MGAARLASGDFLTRLRVYEIESCNALLDILHFADCCALLRSSSTD